MPTQGCRLMRTILDVQADRAAALARLAELDREEAAIRAARDAKIIAAFDAGEKAKNIAAHLGLTLNTVTGVLARNNRFATHRRVPIGRLPPAQQRTYAKLRRNGIPPMAARSIAQAVPT